MLPVRMLPARRWIRRVPAWMCLAVLLAASSAPQLGAQIWPIPTLAPVELGHLLFVREWQERDARSAAGDGLGPMFNARSCVACHNQGGTGGSGSLEHNVDLLCLAPTQPMTRIDRRQFVADAGRIHPAFVVDATTALPTITLHRSSTYPVYGQWRAVLATMATDSAAAKQRSWIRLRQFERRTPSLFGAGLIDAIPPETLHQVAHQQAATSGVRGRVALATDGGVGKFGWRGQTSTLKKFVLGACANELGLHVPTATQPRDPLGLSGSTPGLDMDELQCDSLVAYVASLPAPAQRQPASPRERDFWLAGERVFERTGCAACHLATLGNATGIYSDLLLHDMGPELADPAGANPPGQSGMTKAFDATLYYGGTTDVFVAVPPETQRQWRTPPLWGLAENGPYLHDGRARTVDDAILRHGGEAKAARAKYAALGQEKRVQLFAFLYSVGVPPGTTRIAAARP
ncbi:MAG: di-heme oxidoredictase family protein [Pirellulales bacterium]